MLTQVIVGRESVEGALVITPEFFAEVRKTANQSWGAYIRLRFYPLIRQWVVLKGVPGTPQNAVMFEVATLDVGRFPIVISKKHFEVFSGKVLGYDRSIPGIQMSAFLEKEVQNQ